MHVLNVHSLYTRLRARLPSRRKQDPKTQPTPLWSILPRPSKPSHDMQQSSVQSQTPDTDYTIPRPSRIPESFPNKIDQQLQSNFFAKLPLEIRVLIYREVLQDTKNIHQNVYSQPLESDSREDFGRLDITFTMLRYCNTYIEKSNGEIRRLRCFAEDCGIEYTGQIAPWHYMPFPPAECDVGEFERESRSYLLDRLSLTCRKMYMETLGTIYSEPTFIFHDLFEAHRFLTTLPRPRLNRIHSIRIAWFHDDLELLNAQVNHTAHPSIAQWQEICDILSSMNALVDLHVSVFCHYSSRPPIMPEKEVLAPLMKVRARKFVVQLPWQPNFSTTDDFIEAPFTLKRPLPDAFERVREIETGPWSIQVANVFIHPGPGIISRVLNRVLQ